MVINTTKSITRDMKSKLHTTRFHVVLQYYWCW